MSIQPVGKNALAYQRGNEKAENNAESAKEKALDNQIQRQKDFAKALKMLDDHLAETERRRKREEAQRKQAEHDERVKEKKIQELTALIAHLRSKVANSRGGDSSAQARLDAAETELFWLTFSFGGAAGL